MDLLFTKLLQADNSIKEFTFKKPLSGSMSLFQVKVSDDMGTTSAFRMQKEGKTGWKIVEQELPQWIYETAVALNETIEEKLLSEKV